MARPQKRGIDYFSHDVDMANDRKIRLIKAKYGLIGYAIYLILLEELYSEEGYYIHIDEEFNLLFCDVNNIDINVYNNVINDCINYKLFNINLFNAYNVLTSKRIQENYISAVERRKNVDMIESLVLVEIVNDNINLVNDNIYPQSKVKKSKVKKSKEYYRKFAHLELSIEDFKKLNEDYTKEQIDDVLNRIENYKKNKSYTSLYLTSLNWLKKDFNNTPRSSEEPNKYAKYGE